MRILCAEDDADDRAQIGDALRATGAPMELRFVKDGEELLDALRARGGPESPAPMPRPDIIFLDLWMPRKDGRQALREIKADPSLRQIPVIVLTTSKAEEDVFRSYDLGAASFLRKSATFDSLAHVMKAVGDYWFQVVDLPNAKRG